MTRNLNHSPTHRIIESPVGALLDNPLYERLKMASLRGEFQLLRVAAAARATLAADDDRFLQELGLPTAISSNLRSRISAARRNYRLLQSRVEQIEQSWAAALWSPAGPPPPDQLLQLERRRRSLSEQWIAPRKLFGFLARNPFIPPLKFEIPEPSSAPGVQLNYLPSPPETYSAPDMPDVSVSGTLPGPAGPEYFVRFMSPLLEDTVYARVYEPDDGADDLPTIIYGSGAGMAYDLVAYWPEEEYMGRAMAARGYRVILPESPWHGRRTPPGAFSGERYFAGAPLSLIQLYAAQAQETAVLSRWARDRGARAVIVGGISLGGIVAQQVAGWCGAWSAEMRPDLVLIIASSGHIDRVVLQSSVATTLGLDEAVRRAGWTPERLAELQPWLDPRPTPGLAPERIYAVLGSRDQAVPFPWANDLLDSWQVPITNRLTWDTGHFGVLLRTIRSDAIPQLIDRALADHQFVEASHAGQRT